VVLADPVSIRSLEDDAIMSVMGRSFLYYRFFFITKTMKDSNESYQHPFPFSDSRRYTTERQHGRRIGGRVAFFFLFTMLVCRYLLLLYFTHSLDGNSGMSIKTKAEMERMGWMGGRGGNEFDDHDVCLELHCATLRCDGIQGYVCGTSACLVIATR
jgi:hypothetical protein